MAAHEHDLIQTRASDATGSILDLAAAIPDRRSLALNDEDCKSFLAILDAPAKTDEALRARMKRKPIWEKAEYQSSLRRTYSVLSA